MKETFDQFLQSKCLEENPHILDDMLPDFFSNWILEVDVQELIDYGQEYGDKIRQFVIKELSNIQL